MGSIATAELPRAFIWRRLHSLFGLWIVLFLCEHLLTNSQAALFLGEDGAGFVRMVNAIHNFPYLEVIEIVLIGVPIAFHGIIGIRYLLSGKFNSGGSDGTKPTFRGYPNNHAYTWQRITSWFLLGMLIFHVVKFRFLEYPHSVTGGQTKWFFVKLEMDRGLYSVADRLNVQLYDHGEVEIENGAVQRQRAEAPLVEVSKAILRERSEGKEIYDSHKNAIVQAAQHYQKREAFVAGLNHFRLIPGEVVCVTEQFGTAVLLTVREAFKNPYYIALYTLFVLAACFHGFNGLWTFLLTWGFIIKMGSQRKFRRLAIGLMLLVSFLGLSAVWGTYWLNLRE